MAGAIVASENAVKPASRTCQMIINVYLAHTEDSKTYRDSLKDTKQNTNTNRDRLDLRYTDVKNHERSPISQAIHHKPHE